MHCAQGRAGGTAEGQEGEFPVLHSVLIVKNGFFQDSSR